MSHRLSRRNVDLASFYFVDDGFSILLMNGFSIAFDQLKENIT